jgi:hypothetical protein
MKLFLGVKKVGVTINFIQAVSDEGGCDRWDR